MDPVSWKEASCQEWGIGPQSLSLAPHLRWLVHVCVDAYSPEVSRQQRRTRILRTLESSISSGSYISQTGMTPLLCTSVLSMKYARAQDRFLPFKKKETETCQQDRDGWWDAWTAYDRWSRKTCYWRKYVKIERGACAEERDRIKEISLGVEVSCVGKMGVAGDTRTERKWGKAREGPESLDVLGLELATLRIVSLQLRWEGKRWLLWFGYMFIDCHGCPVEGMSGGKR